MPSAHALADLIRSAEAVTVFTGAGISTESGIPDFRSPGGVWSRMRPIPFAEFVASPTARREAWDRVFANASGWVGAVPNDGHFAVAQLAQTGKVTAVITQNVDNLHQDAGTPPDRVIESHGNASYATCLDCAQRYELPALKPVWAAGDDIVCAACGGYIKTAVISFGQPMPRVELERSIAAATSCELFLVLGSSLVVKPANTLPALAKRSGAELVIVNREPTPLDGHADLTLAAEIGPLLRDVMRRVEG